MDVRVPANATAEVHVPAVSPGAVLEGGAIGDGGVSVLDADGVVEVVQSGEVAVVTIGSGSYRFTTDEVAGAVGTLLVAAEAAYEGGVEQRATGAFRDPAASSFVGQVEQAVDHAVEALGARVADDATGVARGLAAAEQAATSAQRTLDNALRSGRVDAAAAEELTTLVRAVLDAAAAAAGVSAGLTLDVEVDPDQVLPGEPATVRVEIANTGDRPLTDVALEVSTPSRWQLRSDTGAPRPLLRSGERVVRVLELDVPADHPVGNEEVVAEVSARSVTATASVRAVTPVEVITPVVLEEVEAVPPVVDPGGSTSIEVDVHNRGHVRTVTPRVELELPDGYTSSGPADVELLPGATRSVTIDVDVDEHVTTGATVGAVARLDDAEVARAEVELYLRGVDCERDPSGLACLAPGFRVLHTFTDGVEHFTAGSNTASVEAVTSFANDPGGPRLGDQSLEATPSSDTPGEAWRSVGVAYDDPIEIGDARAMVVHLNGYGGASGATGYEARLTLTGDRGTPLEVVTSVEPDRWNEVRADLDDWDAEAITGVEIAFRALTSAGWGGRFQVDLVGLDPTALPDPADNLAAGAPVTARTDLTCCGWGSANLTDGRRESTASHRGYTSDPWHTSPDGHEWVAVDLGSTMRIDELWLFPRTPVGSEPPEVAGANFPVDLDVQVSPDGASWTTVHEVRGQPGPSRFPQGYAFAPVDARFVRVDVTRLGRPSPDEAGDGYHRLQLAELEVYAAD